MLSPRLASNRPAFIALAAALLTAACSIPDDKEQIDRRIQAAIEGAQERDVGKILKHVADDFEGPRRMNRAAVRAVLSSQLRDVPWRRIINRKLLTEVNGTSGRSSLHLIVAEGERPQRLEDLAATNAGSLIFDIVSEKRDGRWWIVKASYESGPLTIESLATPPGQ